MKVLTFNNEEEWLAAKAGRITGTNCKDVMPKERGSGKRAGFYDLIAKRVALPPDGENVMDRGLRLESEALNRFAKETGKKVVHTQYTLCIRDDNPDIGYSPDGMIGKTEDVEAKCRNSAAHIEVILTKEIPSEYKSQIIQGFVVNEKLRKRHLVFYDPRCPKDFFYITVSRKDFEKEIEKYLEIEKQALKEIKNIEMELTF